MRSVWRPVSAPALTFVTSVAARVYATARDLRTVTHPDAVPVTLEVTDAASVASAAAWAQDASKAARGRELAAPYHQFAQWGRRTEGAFEVTSMASEALHRAGRFP